MSEHKVQRAVSIIALFWLTIICGKTMIASFRPEATFGDKASLGSSLRQRGEFYRAIAVFDEALQIACKLNESKGQIECLLQLGIVHWNIGKIKESVSFYRRALILSQNLGRKDFEAECSGYIQIYNFYIRGKEAHASGLYKESIAHFDSAIEVARKIKSPEHELKCLRQMSFSYLRLEMYDKYLSINEIGLEIAIELNHQKEEGKFINNIGLSNLLTCNYSKALVLFKKALRIAQVTKDNELDKSIYLTNIGLAYYHLGHHEKAVAYLEQALEIDFRLNDEEGICIDLNNIGTAYSSKGRHLRNNEDLRISLDYYFRSLDFAIKANNKRSEIDTLNNIGLVYGTLGYYDAATRYFNLAIQKIDQIEYTYESCNIHCNMGYALYGMGQYQRSMRHFEKALEIAFRVGRDDILWEVYDGLGGCLEKLGNKNGALVCYRKAIDAIDLIRSRLALDDFRAAFSRDKAKAYERLLDILFRLNEKEGKARYDVEITRVVERAKARSFLEELSLEKGTKSSPDDIINKGEQDALLNKISITVSHLTKPGLDEIHRNKLLARLEMEEEEYTNLLNRIGTEYLENTPPALPEIVPMDRIQGQCLDKRTVILQYYLGETLSIGIFLDEKKLILKALPPRMEIENSLKAYLKMLSAPPDGRFMGAQAAQRIYRELIFPFEEDISSPIEHLIIVPDGILHYLPFETLIKNDPRTSGSKYLIELYDISYAPSVSSLAHLMEKKRPERYAKALLAVGDPVFLLNDVKPPKKGEKHDHVLREIFLKDGFELTPLSHSRKEIRRVARCFSKEKVDVLLDTQAKEEFIKNKPLEGYQIIHFACHGFLDEKTPMRSALVLTLDDDVEEDGFLQAREISSLSLNADLVVLSACQTGRGRLENAEGVIGLPRTFFFAGARSTISSLWKISDRSTSEIMPRFYRHLTDGKNKARALRLAKLELLRSKHSHPFYWGAFVLNGDHTWEAGWLKPISSK
ncbi:MAG: CHAT domain-containing protein [Candidatus Aminicenantales bacterium]